MIYRFLSNASIELKDVYELYEKSLLNDQKAIKIIVENRDLMRQYEDLNDRIRDGSRDGLNQEEYNTLSAINSRRFESSRELNRLNYKRWTVNMTDEQSTGVDPRGSTTEIKVISRGASSLKNSVLDDLYILGEFSIAGHRRSNFLRPEIIIYRNNVEIGTAKIKDLSELTFSVTIRYGNWECEFKEPIYTGQSNVVCNGQSIGYIQYSKEDNSLMGYSGNQFRDEFLLGYVLINILRRTMVFPTSKNTP